MEIVDHPEMLAAQISALLSDPTVVEEVSLCMVQAIFVVIRRGWGEALSCTDVSRARYCG